MALTVSHSDARPRSRMGVVRALVAMTRPSQVALIMVIYLDGVLLAAWRGSTIPNALASVAVGLVLVALVAVAAHLANEAADHATDRLTRRTPYSGGSGALEASGLDARVPLKGAVLAAVVVVALTGLLVVAGQLPGAAAALLLLGLAGALGYSLPPVAAMRRGWGEPLNALVGGLLLPLSGVAVLAGTLEMLDVIAFLPLLLVSFASVLATAWPDRAADVATGKATMQVRLPTLTLRRIHAFASGAAVLAMVLAAASGAMPLALLGLLVLPALVLGLRDYTRRESPLPNVVVMVGLVAIQTVVLAGVVLL